MIKGKEQRWIITYRCIHALAQLSLESSTALCAISSGRPAVCLQRNIVSNKLTISRFKVLRSWNAKPGRQGIERVDLATKEEQTY